MSAIKILFKKKKKGVKGKKEKDLNSAQHYLECDSCEEEAAKFVCRTCPGYLCENCKSEHGMKKITKNHDIVLLTSKNLEREDILFCDDHVTRKMECYCNPCGKPVCTDCIVQSHNGHSFKSLSSALSDIRASIQFQRDEVEKNLIPLYEKLLANEDSKRSLITEKADKIKRNIEQHIQNLIKIVKSTGETYIQELQEEKEANLQQIDVSKAKIEEKLQTLEKIDDFLSKTLDMKTSISFMTPVDLDGLVSPETLSSPPDFNLSEFEPGDLNKYIEKNFGISHNVPQIEPSAGNLGYMLRQQHGINNTHGRSPLMDADLLVEKERYERALLEARK